MSRSSAFLLFLLILSVYLIACWVDGSKRLSACVCVDCASATPKVTAEIESEEGF